MHAGMRRALALLIVALGASSCQTREANAAPSPAAEAQPPLDHVRNAFQEAGEKKLNGESRRTSRTCTTCSG